MRLVAAPEIEQNRLLRIGKTCQLALEILINYDIVTKTHDWLLPSVKRHTNSKPLPNLLPPANTSSITWLQLQDPKIPNCPYGAHSPRTNLPTVALAKV